MKSNFLLLKCRQKLVKLNPDKVSHIQVDDYLSTVYCQETGAHHCCQPLKKLAAHLPPSFLSISRSCIINPKHVVEIDVAEKKVKLTDGQWIPVSRSNWKGLMEKLKEPPERKVFMKKEKVYSY
jgi:DNA-binding LytR/AlgR family response regulator